jgi:glycosyltransferase involved in cell wall biosynthesis
VCKALSEKARSLSPKSRIVQIEDIPLSPDYNGSAVTKLSQQLLEQFALTDCKRIVYTGNLEAYQGIDLLIDSWEIFCSFNKPSNDYKLIIVGGTEDKISDFKKKAASKKIEYTICWIGQRPFEEMKGWMNLSHVLVSSRSEGENTPLKIYSYMASGRPIVATRRLTHTQVLNDSTAILAEPSPKQFAKAIYDAIHNRKAAIQKAERAKELVEEKYSYSIFSKKLSGAYANIR